MSSLSKLAAVELAVASITEGLVADDYDMRIMVVDSTYIFTIAAGKDACAECLVPKPIMEELLAAELQKSGLEVGFSLSYPADA